jgi:hypothetical protein
MKKVLSLLLAFVFLHVQAHALSGGPRYSGGSATSLTGTYSGVLTGPINALGIFVVGIHDVGPADGDFNIFISGSFYGGSILGIGDPQNSTFQGVLDAQLVSSFSFFADPFFGVQSGAATVEGTAAGLVQATVVDAGGITGGTSSTRMQGTANVAVRERIPLTSTTDANGVVTTTGGGFQQVASLDFVVDGFKQSSDGNAAQQAQTLRNFGGGGGTGTTP